MEKVLLPCFYLPPVSWFANFVREDYQPVLEIFENFPKQTYRNRANIYGANGKLSLIIPIAHGGARCMKDIRISYAEDWQKLHQKSIKNAYQSSPYFEYYEDRLFKIFEKKSEFLTDFNLNALEVLKEILKIEKSAETTSHYQKTPDGLDFRNQYSAKEEFAGNFEPYFQVFAEKYGFIKDLSIVDLLCNLGPESATYIKNLTKINS